MRIYGLLTGWFVVMAVVLTGTACRKSHSTPPTPIDSTYYGRIKFILQENVDYYQFTASLQQAGLLDTLATPGSFTILLTNDNPYVRADVGSYIYEAPGDQIMRYQILPGTIRFDSLPVALDQQIPTLLGTSVFVSKYVISYGNTADTVITVNGEQVAQPDVPAQNGLIQVLKNDTATAYCVLPVVFSTLEDELNSRPDVRLLSVIFQRLNAWSLLQGMGPFTLLAPTNDAITGNSNLGIQSVEDVYNADSAQLLKFVRNLIIPGRYFLTDFYYNYLTTGTSTYNTLAGQTITLSFSPNYPTGISYNFSGQGNANPINLNPSNSYLDADGEPVKNAVMIITNDVILPQ